MARRTLKQGRGQARDGVAREEADDAVGGWGRVMVGKGRSGWAATGEGSGAATGDCWPQGGDSSDYGGDLGWA